MDGRWGLEGGWIIAASITSMYTLLWVQSNWVASSRGCLEPGTAVELTNKESVLTPPPPPGLQLPHVYLMSLMRYVSLGPSAALVRTGNTPRIFVDQTLTHTQLNATQWLLTTETWAALKLVFRSPPSFVLACSVEMQKGLVQCLVCVTATPPSPSLAGVSVLLTVVSSHALKFFVLP